MTVRLNALAAIAAACLSSAAPAIAQERVPVTTRVMIADLNLGNAAGMATLKARVRRAAESACRTDMPGLAGTTDAARCRHEMERDGTAQIARRMSTGVQVAAAR